MDNYQDMMTPLHMASALGLTDLMELLLERGASVQTQDAFGQTPLHHAVRPSLYGRDMGYAKPVALLLDRGASINTPNRDGRTPQDLFFSPPGLTYDHVRVQDSNRVYEPEPVLDHDIGELLRNKSLVFKVQKLDKERAARYS